MAGARQLGGGRRGRRGQKGNGANPNGPQALEGGRLSETEHIGGPQAEERRDLTPGFGA